MTDFADVLADDTIDGVVIATPVDTHFTLAKAALEAGKHVLVEKPLATTSADCEALIALADERDLRLMVGHVFVYNPAVRRVKELIDSGELGDVYYIYSQRLNLGQVRHDVNALWNFAPHDVSILCYWLDAEPTEVTARGFSYVQPGIEDVVFMTLDFPGGVGANVHISWLDPLKVRRMTVVGSEKMVVYDDVSADAKITVYDKGVTKLLVDKSEASLGELPHVRRVPAPAAGRRRAHPQARVHRAAQGRVPAFRRLHQDRGNTTIGWARGASGGPDPRSRPAIDDDGLWGPPPRPRRPDRSLVGTTVAVPAKALATTPSIARLRVAVVYLIVFAARLCPAHRPGFRAWASSIDSPGTGRCSSPRPRGRARAVASGRRPAPVRRRAVGPVSRGVRPIAHVPPFVLGTGWALLPLWLTLALAFAVMLALVSRVHLKLPTVSTVGQGATAGSSSGWRGSASPGSCWCFGIPTRIPSLNEVPGARLDFREDLAGAGRLAGYAVWWTEESSPRSWSPMGCGSGAPGSPWPDSSSWPSSMPRRRSGACCSWPCSSIVLLALLVRVRRDFGATIAMLTSVLDRGLFRHRGRRLVHPDLAAGPPALIVPGQVMAYYYDAFSTGPVYALPTASSVV